VVDVEVESGTLGSDLKEADHSTFMGHELFVPPGVRRKVYMPVGGLGAALTLMCRNANANDHSVAFVYRVEIGGRLSSRRSRNR
jgi:hypothetical protein